MNSVSTTRSLHAFLGRFAPHDFLIVIFQAFLFWLGMVATGVDQAHEARLSSARLLGAFLVVASVVLILIFRFTPLPKRLRNYFYRLGFFLTIGASYLEIGDLIRGMSPISMDAPLYEIDQWLLGQTPSVWMNRFNEIHWVEWFSFFYFSYFAAIVVMLAGNVFVETNARRRAELLTGGALVGTLGHILYTFVPGLGPFHHLNFPNELDGGYWWSLVSATVAENGSGYDIFPSLHTAYPTLFMLHCVRHVRHRIFTFAAPVYVFFGVNMIIATMFLRWHWAIDVVAGLCLAFFAHRAAIFIAARISPQKLWG